MSKFLAVFILLMLSFGGLNPAEAQKTQDNGKSGVIRVRKYQDPDPHIAGKKGGDISAAELCNSQGIVSMVEGVRIIYFEMTYFRGGEVTKEVNGNLIPAEVCSYLSTAQTGLMITFENIMGQDARGVKFKMNPMRFKLNGTITPQPSNPAFETIRPEIDINGVYQLNTAKPSVEKTYLKLYNDSIVFYLSSVDPPAIVSQRLEREYKTQQTCQGKYRIVSNQLIIELDDTVATFDLEGSYNGSGLRLKRKQSNSTLVGEEMQFFKVPVSR